MIGLETEKDYGSNVFSDCPKLVVNELFYVGVEMFSMCNSITSVRFKGSRLERGLFMHCLNLVSFECQGQVNEIPDICFYGCINLVDVVLPPSVETIGNLAFCNTSLKNGFSFQYIRRIGDLSFAYSHLKTVALNNTEYEYHRKEEQFMSDSDRKDIIYVAPFRRCNEITKVAFLGEYPPMMAFFDECDNIREIEVPTDNFIVDNEIIYDKDKSTIISCSLLCPYESFTVPDTVQNIYNLAFYGTKKLKNLTSNHALEIGIAAFMKSSLENIVLDDQIEGKYYESQYAIFGYSKNLKNVVYKCEQASYFDFIYCESLESIQSQFERIALGVFYGCKSLKEIDLKNSRHLQHICFRDCYSLKRVEFGIQIEEIYPCAFKNCINLEEVVFDQRCELRNINYETFMNCIRLTSVTLPPNLQVISVRAFANTSLNEVRILPSMHIENHAFDFCPNIKIVTTAVYEHEYIDYNRGDSLVTTLGKQNSTYIVPEGLVYFDPLVLDSNIVFNETVGAYEKDLGIRTIIIPNSTQQIYVRPGPTAILNSPFIENYCYDGQQIQIEHMYEYVWMAYTYSGQYFYPYDLEITGMNFMVDIDCPIPVPTLYAPNLAPGEEDNINIPVVRAPCPNTTKQHEKIYLGSVNHKKVYIKNGQVVNLNSNPEQTNQNSSSEEHSGSLSSVDTNNPIISIFDQNSANTNTKLTTRETIIIAVCASVVVLVIIFSIAYVYMKTKATEPSDDSDVLEMAEETIQASIGVTFDNPLYMTTAAVSDDPFAKDFQNEDYSNEFYINQRDDE